MANGSAEKTPNQPLGSSGVGHDLRSLDVRGRPEEEDAQLDGGERGDDELEGRGDLHAEHVEQPEDDEGAQRDADPG